MLLRLLKNDESGVTAVEFGLLAIPLMILLLGGTDVAHQAYMRSQLQGALADTARRAAVQEPAFQTLGSTLEERITASIADTMEPVAPGAVISVEISNYFDFSGVGNPEKLMTDVNDDGVYNEEDGDCFEDLNENGVFDLDTGRSGLGGANDVAFYEAKAVMPRLIPMTGLLGLSENVEVNATMAIRNQPYALQTTPPIICGTPS